MEPEVSVNGTVILRDCDFDEVEIGDIIRYNNGRFYVLHRVITRDTDENGDVYLITKGDANKYADDMRIYEDDFCGKVEFIWNDSKKFLSRGHSPWAGPGCGP